MDANEFKKIVEKARNNPEFFHSLVFDTERTLSEFDEIDSRAKSNILSISPEYLIATLVGEVSGCDFSYTCSCTSGTCGGSTCGGSTCSATCTGDSCGNTCGDSCGWTSNYRSFERGHYQIY